MSKVTFREKVAEWYAKHKKECHSSPEYALVGTEGPNHMQFHIMTCTMKLKDGRVIVGTEKGRKKKDAKEAAAKMAYYQLCPEEDPNREAMEKAAAAAAATPKANNTTIAIATPPTTAARGLAASVQSRLTPAVRRPRRRPRNNTRTASDPLSLALQALIKPPPTEPASAPNPDLLSAPPGFKPDAKPTQEPLPSSSTSTSTIPKKQSAPAADDDYADVDDVDRIDLTAKAKVIPKAKAAISTSASQKSNTTDSSRKRKRRPPKTYVTKARDKNQDSGSFESKEKMDKSEFDNRMLSHLEDLVGRLKKGKRGVDEDKLHKELGDEPRMPGKFRRKRSAREFEESVTGRSKRRPPGGPKPYPTRISYGLGDSSEESEDESVFDQAFRRHITENQKVEDFITQYKQNAEIALNAYCYHHQYKVAAPPKKRVTLDKKTQQYVAGWMIKVDGETIKVEKAHRDKQFAIQHAARTLLEKLDYNSFVFKPPPPQKVQQWMSGRFDGRSPLDRSRPHPSHVPRYGRGGRIYDQDERGPVGGRRYSNDRNAWGPSSDRRRPPTPASRWGGDGSIPWEGERLPVRGRGSTKFEPGHGRRPPAWHRGRPWDDHGRGGMNRRAPPERGRWQRDLYPGESDRRRGYSPPPQRANSPPPRRDGTNPAPRRTPTDPWQDSKPQRHPYEHPYERDTRLEVSVRHSRSSSRGKSVSPGVQSSPSPASTPEPEEVVKEEEDEEGAVPEDKPVVKKETETPALDVLNVLKSETKPKAEIPKRKRKRRPKRRPAPEDKPSEPSSSQPQVQPLQPVVQPPPKLQPITQQPPALQPINTRGTMMPTVAPAVSVSQPLRPPPSYQASMAMQQTMSSPPPLQPPPALQVPQFQPRPVIAAMAPPSFPTPPTIISAPADTTGAWNLPDAKFAVGDTVFVTSHGSVAAQILDVLEGNRYVIRTVKGDTFTGIHANELAEPRKIPYTSVDEGEMPAPPPSAKGADYWKFYQKHAQQQSHQYHAPVLQTPMRPPTLAPVPLVKPAPPIYAPLTKPVPPAGPPPGYTLPGAAVAAASAPSKAALQARARLLEQMRKAKENVAKKLREEREKEKAAKNQPAEKDEDVMTKEEMEKMAKRIRRVVFETGAMGIFWKGGTVGKVRPGSQSEKLGVQKGWEVLTVNNVEVLPSNTVAMIKDAMSQGPDELIIMFDTAPEPKPQNKRAKVKVTKLAAPAPDTKPAPSAVKPDAPALQGPNADVTNTPAASEADEPQQHVDEPTTVTIPEASLEGGAEEDEVKTDVPESPPTETLPDAATSESAVGQSVPGSLELDRLVAAAVAQGPENTDVCSKQEADTSIPKMVIDDEQPHQQQQQQQQGEELVVDVLEGVDDIPRTEVEPEPVEQTSTEPETEAVKVGSQARSEPTPVATPEPGETNDASPAPTTAENSAPSEQPAEPIETIAEGEGEGEEEGEAEVSVESEAAEKEVVLEKNTSQQEVILDQATVDDGEKEQLERAETPPPTKRSPRSSPPPSRAGIAAVFESTHQVRKKKKLNFNIKSMARKRKLEEVAKQTETPAEEAATGPVAVSLEIPSGIPPAPIPPATIPTATNEPEAKKPRVAKRRPRRRPTD